MKPSILSVVPVVLALAACAFPTAPAAAADGETGEEAPWTEQNRAMGYLILHLSNVNVVQGLNLSREQAVALREVARQVESASPALPPLAGGYRPDLAEVRDAYLEVRRRLLADEPIDDAFRKRVGQARATEAAVVRLSLTQADASRQGCARCHGEPEPTDVRPLGARPFRHEVDQGVQTAASKRKQFLAHAEGLLGRRGLVTVALLAGEVDRILLPAQKEGLRDFSCCIFLPKDMDDPYRIGQAESGERQVKMLRQVRGVPPHLWPLVRDRMLERMEAVAVTIRPGADGRRKEALREQVAEVCEEARTLSDVDFELDKHRLAADLTRAARPPASETPQPKRGRRFTAAFFLTVPGAVEVYDRLIERLDAQAQAARQDNSASRKAAKAQRRQTATARD